MQTLDRKEKLQEVNILVWSKILHRMNDMIFPTCVDLDVPLGQKIK